MFGGGGGGGATPAPTQGLQTMYGAGGTDLGGGGGAGGPPKQNMMPGDWNCEKCGDHQFARNLSCRKCSAPRPASAGPVPGGGYSAIAAATAASREALARKHEGCSRSRSPRG